jgi:hypothetical protein
LLGNLRAVGMDLRRQGSHLRQALFAAQRGTRPFAAVVTTTASSAPRFSALPVCGPGWRGPCSR